MICKRPRALGKAVLHPADSERDLDGFFARSAKVLQARMPIKLGELLSLLA